MSPLLFFPFNSFSLFLRLFLVEWHSTDHGRLHVHVSEHSPFIAATHGNLAHVLDSLVCAHLSYRSSIGTAVKPKDDLAAKVSGDK